MKAPNITKGPWNTESLYISDIPENATVVITAPAKSNIHSTTRVAEVTFAPEGSYYHVDDRAEAEANAKLIAAAPMLAEALNCFWQAGVGNSTDFSLQFEAAKSAKAALLAAGYTEE